VKGGYSPMTDQIIRMKKRCVHRPRDRRQGNRMKAHENWGLPGECLCHRAEFIDRYGTRLPAFHTYKD
jgi:hypothetical protein